MDTELFPMRKKERRKVDGNLNSKNSKKNRRKSDKKEDNPLYSLMESVYISNGIIFTDSLDKVSNKVQEYGYSDVAYDRLLGKEKNYIVQSGTFVIVLDNLDFFEHTEFDNTKLQEMILNLENSKMQLLLYNGAWWVKKEQDFVDIKYKNALEEEYYLDDLKEMVG